LACLVDIGRLHVTDTQAAVPAAQSLPRDLVLSQALDVSEFEMSWLPTEPTDVQEPAIVKWAAWLLPVHVTCTPTAVQHVLAAGCLQLPLPITLLQDWRQAGAGRLVDSLPCTSIKHRDSMALSHLSVPAGPASC
jgi:hypothetical protein